MQGFVPMSDITPSLPQIILYFQIILSYLLRFLLSWKIVSTIIFWFYLIKFMNSLLSVGNCTSLHTSPLPTSPPVYPISISHYISTNLHCDLQIFPLIFNPPHHSTPHQRELPLCNPTERVQRWGSMIVAHDCPEQQHVHSLRIQCVGVHIGNHDLGPLNLNVLHILN